MKEGRDERKHSKTFEAVQAKRKYQACRPTPYSPFDLHLKMNMRTGTRHVVLAYSELYPSHKQHVSNAARTNSLRYIIADS